MKLHSIGQDLQDHFLMKSLRGKPRSIMFLEFNSLLSQQAAGEFNPGEIKYGYILPIQLILSEK
jgi:hypothetical protein